MIDKDETVRDIRSFNRFYTNVIRVVDRHILDSHYSLTEARVLFEIDRDPQATARRIRRLLSIDEGYLSRTIEKLTERGLIIRDRSETDRRNFTLALSERGRAEYKALDELSSKSVETLLLNLPENELETLIASMREIARILGKGTES